jgi:hypothetical protein
MGIRASLQSIPPEIVDILRAERAYEPGSDVLGQDYDWMAFEVCSLDKTWWGIHQAFKGAEGPLRYLIEGDYGFPGGVDAFVIQSEADHYLGYVSAKVVVELARQLAGLSETEVTEAFARAGLDYDGYFQSYFKEMIGFYLQTAVERRAVVITIS